MFRNDSNERWERERATLLERIDAEFEATKDHTGRTELDARVRQSISDVSRHLFVPPAEKPLAYINHALPIGFHQTISQPFIVALMTDVLETRPHHVVLEIGTGSGYQAAVLSSLVRKLYSIEVIEKLARSAADRLRRLGYSNVDVRSGNGALGWPEHAPYDGIIVTAAAPAVPPKLIEQLKPNGRLVMPIGDPFGQSLTLIKKRPDGTLDTRPILPVAFVPLVGGRQDR